MMTRYNVIKFPVFPIFFSDTLLPDILIGITLPSGERISFYVSVNSFNISYYSVKFNCTYGRSARTTHQHQNHQDN